MFNMQAFQAFVTNPRQFFAKQGLPGNVQTPQDAIQYLMNTGRISQADYSNLLTQAKQIQDSPMFQQLIKK